MIDTFMPSLSAIFGALVLVVFLPFVVAVSLGLLIVAIARRKVFAGIIAVAFPLATYLLGIWTRDSGLNNPASPPSLAASVDTMTGLLAPYSLILAGIAFLIGVLPKIVSVFRNA